ncbi:MAG: hypothetical protein CM1200mP36_10560 [Gammaproteobacteria bacterium]|nr:MAG: hypothetical protein CM1200mP36_10560 [Gammaproteobacteria bacterium]
MTLKRDPTKALQFGFLALLVISTAQVAWWIADQTSLASSNRNRVEALYEADALAVTAVLAGSTEELPALMPHLEIDPVERTASVREEAVQALGEATESDKSLHLGKGGFFLLVLLGGNRDSHRTIRHDAELGQGPTKFPRCRLPRIQEPSGKHAALRRDAGDEVTRSRHTTNRTAHTGRRRKTTANGEQPSGHHTA